MAHQINKKIISYKVISNEDKANAEQAIVEAQKQDLESMHENVARPEILYGSTYKIKTPQRAAGLAGDTGIILRIEGSLQLAAGSVNAHQRCFCV